MKAKDRKIKEKVFLQTLLDRGVDAWGLGMDKVALQLFKIAAEGGIVDAFVRLGVCYDYGEGVKRNSELALYWYKEGAARGSEDAFFHLGYCYDLGRGVRKNLKLAMYWYKKAACYGNTTAINNIGIIYHDEGDIRKARFWLGKLVKICDGDGAIEMAKTYLKSKNKGNIKKAKNYLRFALKQKNITEGGIEDAIMLLKSLNS